MYVYIYAYPHTHLGGGLTADQPSHRWVSRRSWKESFSSFFGKKAFVKAAPSAASHRCLRWESRF